VGDDRTSCQRDSTEIGWKRRSKRQSQRQGSARPWLTSNVRPLQASPENSNVVVAGEVLRAMRPFIWPQLSCCQPFVYLVRVTQQHFWLVYRFCWSHQLNCCVSPISYNAGNKTPRDAWGAAMPRDYADTLMRELLTDAGLDFDKPSLPIAWDCFKRFIQRPLPEVTSRCSGFECYQASDRDDVLWFGLMRHLAEPDQLDWSCGCLFSCTSPHHLKNVQDQYWWWPEQESFDSWVHMVEHNPTFISCMSLDDWKWEGFSE